MDWCHSVQWDLEGLHWSWRRREVQKQKTCCCLKHWSCHASITIYRAMLWLLTLYMLFYTIGWQQWLGLAFLSDFVFLAPWKPSTVKKKKPSKKSFKTMLLHFSQRHFACCPSLKDAEVHFNSFSGWRAVSDKWMRDCQDQLTPLRPNPDGPEKNEALRGPEEGQLESTRYKRRQTDNLRTLLKCTPVPDFERWDKGIYINPPLASHSHV